MSISKINGIDVGGGTNSIVFGTTFRARIQYNNWYTCNYSYGHSYYYWYQTTSSTSLPTSFPDSNVPIGHTIPHAGKVMAYTIVGNSSTTDTTEFAIMKGNLAGGFGSAGDWTMSQIGSTQSAGGTANIIYKWEQAKDSFGGVSVVAGDFVMPYFRRTTDNDSSYQYLEISYSILMELS